MATGDEGRAERRRADLGDGRPVDLGQHRHAGGVAGLALVGRHAERGVALQVLGDAEALARRELDVGGGHVVLEIDEGLADDSLTCQSGATAALSSSARRCRRCRREAETRCGRIGAGRVAVGEARAEAEAPRCGAGDGHARRQRAGHERRRARRSRPAGRRDAR